MGEARSPGIGLIGLVRQLVDRLTAAKTYLAVIHRRLRRGEVAPSEVEQQFDAAAAATEEVKRAQELTA